MKALPTVVSLFSGAGGLDVGLERAGWQTVVATDIDAAAVQSLRDSQAARIPIRGGGTRRHLESTRIIQADICELTAADLRSCYDDAGWLTRPVR